MNETRKTPDTGGIRRERRGEGGRERKADTEK